MRNNPGGFFEDPMNETNNMVEEQKITDEGQPQREERNRAFGGFQEEILRKEQITEALRQRNNLFRSYPGSKTEGL